MVSLSNNANKVYCKKHTLNATQLVNKQQHETINTAGTALNWLNHKGWRAPDSESKWLAMLLGWSHSMFEGGHMADFPRPTSSCHRSSPLGQSEHKAKKRAAERAPDICFIFLLDDLRLAYIYRSNVSFCFEDMNNLFLDKLHLQASRGQGWHCDMGRDSCGKKA